MTRRLISRIGPHSARLDHQDRNASLGLCSTSKGRKPVRCVAVKEVVCAIGFAEL